MLIANTAVLLLYIASCVLTYRKFRQYCGVLLAYLFIFQAWSIFSCYYNDFGIYNAELFRKTQPSLATSRLGLFYCVFNAGFWAAGLALGRRRMRNVEYVVPGFDRNVFAFKAIAYAVFLAVVVFILYSFAKNGIPILRGIFKAEAARSQNAFGRALQSYGFIFVFMLGCERISHGKVMIYNALFLLLVFYYISIGHKFSMLIEMTVVYSLPVLTWKLYVQPKTVFFGTKTILIGATLMGCVMAVAYFHYMLQGNKTAYQYIIDRTFAFQGHVWWAVDNKLSELGHFDHQHWLQEWEALVGTGDGAAAGMKYILIQILGFNAYSIIESGYLYTMAYPAILVVTFSYPAAVFAQFLAGAIFFLMLFYFYHTIIYQHFFRALLTLLIIFPYIALLFSGVFTTFLTAGLLVKVLIILACERWFIFPKPSAALSAALKESH